MKQVIIDFDCRSSQWIVCETNGCHTDIIAHFDWFSMASEWCDSNGFDWSGV
jgi:hypothetical protein